VDIRLRVPVEPAIWLIVGLAGIAVGTYLFCRGFALLHRKRLILDTPTSTVRSAALGRI